MSDSIETSEGEALPWVKPTRPAPGDEDAPTLTKEETALGAFLSAMHDCHLDGGRMREAMLGVLGIIGQERAADKTGGEVVAWIEWDGSSIAYNPLPAAKNLPHGRYDLYTRPQQQSSQVAQPLTEERIHELLGIGNPDEETCRLIRIGWNAAHSIGKDQVA